MITGKPAIIIYYTFNDKPLPGSVFISPRYGFDAVEKFAASQIEDGLITTAKVVTGYAYAEKPVSLQKAKAYIIADCKHNN